MSSNVGNLEKGNGTPSEQEIGDDEVWEGVSTSGSKGKIKRKRMKDRSEVWEHFIKKETSLGLRAIYKYCNMEYKCNLKKNGTSVLWGHLNRCLALESAFSIGGRFLDVFRSSLSAKVVQGLVCAQNWLRAFTFPSVEECIEEVEQLEEDLENMALGDDIDQVVVD